MIQFVVSLEEEENGRVHIQCATPSSKATLREQDAAREFQAMFKAFALKASKTVVNKDWEGVNNPNRN